MGERNAIEYIRQKMREQKETDLIKASEKRSLSGKPTFRLMAAIKSPLASPTGFLFVIDFTNHFYGIDTNDQPRVNEKLLASPVGNVSY